MAWLRTLARSAEHFNQKLILLSGNPNDDRHFGRIFAAERSVIRPLGRLAGNVAAGVRAKVERPPGRIRRMLALTIAWPECTPRCAEQPGIGSTNRRLCSAFRTLCGLIGATTSHAIDAQRENPTHG